MELRMPTSLRTVSDGEQLMAALNTLTGDLPDVLFLDLNMPRKNGFQCLREIRQNRNLRLLKTIIFSTSNEPEVIELLFKNGADHYVKKPTEFNELKKVIEDVLKIIQTPNLRHSIEKFVLK
jgi:CheY-like chemotaxis protein